ncbi:MAG: copper resistance protein CopD, partial [Psychrobacter sp.]|nr:copper resistance protein CopD [Psychrobacter sp.]
MFNYLLILHLLGAAIWTGGHLILALVVLPKVLSSRNLDALLQF